MAYGRAMGTTLFDGAVAYQRAYDSGSASTAHTHQNSRPVPTLVLTPSSASEPGKGSARPAATQHPAMKSSQALCHAPLYRAAGIATAARTVMTPATNATKEQDQQKPWALGPFKPPGTKLIHKTMKKEVKELPKQTAKVKGVPRKKNKKG